ncbi:MAG TPA: hypothetical protein PKD56_11150, partial [Chitinophagales bacterium]|nr:hypothetical protein [Chitinophagales bacterium]
MSIESKIPIYIAKLLQEYNSVTVPGLGTFSTSITPSKIENGQVAPPLRIIEFNDALKLDDGMMADYIARSENLPNFTVTEAIEAYVQETQRKLSRGESLQIADLGELYLDTTGIEFAPLAANSVSLTDFGLTPVDLPLETAQVIPPATTDSPPPLPQPRSTTSELDSDATTVLTPLVTTTETEEPVVKRQLSDVLAEKAQQQQNSTPEQQKDETASPTNSDKSDYTLLKIVASILGLALVALIFVQLGKGFFGGGSKKLEDPNIAANQSSGVNLNDTNSTTRATTSPENTAGSGSAEDAQPIAQGTPNNATEVKTNDGTTPRSNTSPETASGNSNNTATTTTPANNAPITGRTGSTTANTDGSSNATTSGKTNTSPATTSNPKTNTGTTTKSRTG